MTLIVDTEQDQYPSGFYRTSAAPELRCYVGIAMLAVLLAIFACRMNLELYQHTAPFFDSISYHEHNLRAMHNVSEDGFVQGTINSISGTSTVALPQLIAIAVSPFVEPSRMIGIVVQAMFLCAMLASTFFYLRRCHRLRKSTSYLGCLAIISFGCLYQTVGGLSDYRMDLMLLFNFATTAIWFLVATHESQKNSSRNQPLPTWPFVILGVAAAVTCLCRATAPLYLAAAFGPLAIYFIAVEKRFRIDLTANYGIAFLILLIGAGWFYSLNFEHLKYYYFVWNTDANAEVSLTESLRHFRFARKAIGTPLLVGAMIVLVGIAIDYFRNPKMRKDFPTKLRGRQILFPSLLWIGLAPVLLLVVKRAGYNPFVAMPAAFGFALFVLLPMLHLMDHRNDKQFRRFVSVTLGLVLVASLVVGWVNHRKSKFNSMAANKAILERIQQSHAAQLLASDENTESNEQAADLAIPPENSPVCFGVSTLGELNTSSLFSTLLFDVDADVKTPRTVSWRNTVFQPKHTFFIAAENQWEELDGGNDRERMRVLLRAASAQLDFIILPTKETAKKLAKNTSNQFVNKFALQLRNRFVKRGSWQLVGSAIETSPGYEFEVFQNLDR
jgi:hypothetical protein